MARVEKEIEIKNSQGLHARPAAMFVQIAQKYDSDILIQKGDEKVNGKSIMGILMLGAYHGSKITIIAEGEDAEKAFVELEGYLSAGE
ncbi:MAG: HPr family phosphocarrier protein [Candidatus Omnitrophota bacterium]